MSKPTQLLSVNEVAKKIGRSVQTVYRLTRTGSLPEPEKFKTTAGAKPRMLWEEHLVDKWVEENQPHRRKSYIRSENVGRLVQDHTTPEEDHTLDSVWMNLHAEPWYVQHKKKIAALGAVLVLVAATLIVVGA